MSGLVLAIDPGNVESAYVVLDLASKEPILHGKVSNHDLLQICYGARRGGKYEHIGIEMIASYGMPVGAEVFDTCVWIGRFLEALAGTGHGVPDLIYRRDVKLHHCHTSAAKDVNVRQALVDRFARGQRNYGKGTKAEPGWFHGFADDVWQAYAVGVYLADQINGDH